MTCIQRGYYASPRSWVAVVSCLAILPLVGLGRAQESTAPGAAPIVWAVPSSLLRVGPTDAAGSGTAVTIYGSRGEFVPFQIAVKAPAGGLTNVRLSIPNHLTGPSGATIFRANLILYRESYITVPGDQHSVLDFESCPPAPNLCPTWFYNGDNGTQVAPLRIDTFPDALIPAIDPETGMPPKADATYQFELPSLAAGKNVVFWVDALVPRATPAGNYTGTYAVSSGWGSVEGIIKLTVWNFTLPLRPSLKSLFGGGDSNLSAGGALAAGIEAELLRNKIMPDTAGTALASESTDISRHGLNNFDLGYYENVSYGNCAGEHLKPDPPSLQTLQSAVDAQPIGLYLNDYTADPESSCSNKAYYQSVIAWAKVLHQAVVTGVPGQVGVDNVVSQQPVSELFDDGLGTGRSAVDVWTMLPEDYDSAQLVSTDGTNNVAYVLNKGDKVWSYTDEVIDTYSPKWELDFLPIDYRIWPGFLSQSLGLTGMNYWAVSNWNSEADAWISALSSGNTSPGDYFPGEGILVYPGELAGLQSTKAYQGVAPSMRLKYLRDGVQDYEYIRALKSRACGQATFVRKVMVSLSSSRNNDPNWHDWTMNEAALESARLTLGRKLSSLGCAP